MIVEGPVGTVKVNENNIQVKEVEIIRDSE